MKYLFSALVLLATSLFAETHFGIEGLYTSADISSTLYDRLDADEVLLKEDFEGVDVYGIGASFIARYPAYIFTLSAQYGWLGGDHLKADLAEEDEELS